MSLANLCQESIEDPRPSNFYHYGKISYLGQQVSNLNKQNRPVFQITIDQSICATLV